MSTEPVHIRAGDDVSAGERAALERVAATDARDVAGFLEAATALGRDLPRPGAGRTALLWEALATLAARNLQLARAVEPHLDALAILAEAGAPPPPSGSTWGVYAAEGPHRLRATETDAGWVLSGGKSWCSLGGAVSHALVTAWTDDDHRGLFAVALRDPGVSQLDEPWLARGLRDIRSTGLSFDDVPATAVGAPGWYLERDGFAWGGMGVAAVWWGAAVGLQRRLVRPARREPDQVALMHVGAADVALAAAGSLLATAATQVDRGAAAGPRGALWAGRVRAAVADCCERVLTRVDHALGPAPLVTEADHAARVADLRLYLRQHHAERDEAALGRAVLDLEVW